MWQVGEDRKHHYKEGRFARSESQNRRRSGDKRRKRREKLRRRRADTDRGKRNRVERRNRGLYEMNSEDFECAENRGRQQNLTAISD